MNKKIIIIGILLLFVVSCTTNNVEDKTTDATLLKIKERGKLVVGSDIPYGIMEFYDDNGNPQGIDVDIAKEIASFLGVELEFKDIKWDNLFDAVKNNEIDIAMSSITITPKRSEEMLFSIPYFNGGQVIVTKKETNEILVPDDFIGHKIGVQIDTTGQEEVLKYVDESSITTYLTYECVDEIGMVCDLKNSVIDAIVVDYVAALEIINQDPELEIVGLPFTDEYYGIATNLNNVVLMDKINEELRDLKRTGKIDEIIQKWS